MSKLLQEHLSDVAIVREMRTTQERMILDVAAKRTAKSHTAPPLLTNQELVKQQKSDTKKQKTAAQSESDDEE